VKAVNQQPLPSIRGINTTASQVKALNGQQRPLAAPLPITLINSTAGLNSTAGQNYTFAATSPAAKNVSHSSSKDKDTKPTIPHIKITVTDNDSKAK
jgi:hypothetical protein